MQVEVLEVRAEAQELAAAKASAESSRDFALADKEHALTHIDFLLVRCLPPFPPHMHKKRACSCQL